MTVKGLRFYRVVLIEESSARRQFSDLMPAAKSLREASFNDNDNYLKI